MEEDLGPQEALVTHVHVERRLGHRVDACEVAYPLARLRVVLGKLFGDIGTDVAVLLLDRFGSLEALFRWNAHLPFAQQALDERSDVAAGNGDVLNAGADHVALGLKKKVKLIYIHFILCNYENWNKVCDLR